MKPSQWVRGTRERAGQVKLVAEVRGWAERTIFWRVWERMLENEFIDRGVHTLKGVPDEWQLYALAG